MPVIISHDVDHISSYEHLGDLTIPKYIARAGLELAKGTISRQEFTARLWETANGHWNCIKELSAFDTAAGLRSTFFFAAANGMGLHYAPRAAHALVRQVLADGHDVGIHGIARGMVADIAAEKSAFEQHYGVACRGVRMHYLYPDDSLLPMLAAAGYSYDSSLRGDGSARTVDGMLAFPVHVMDGDIMLQGRRYQSIGLATAVRLTKERISRLADAGTDYISVLFHDRYFSAGHAAWRDWYREMIQWIESQAIGFCSYEQAVAQSRTKAK